MAGIKFLWWTWHDTDAPIDYRILGVPIGSTVWVITFSGAITVNVQLLYNLWLNPVGPLVLTEHDIPVNMANMAKYREGVTQTVVACEYKN